MATALDYMGPVLATSVWVDGVMCARDVKVELPEISPETYDVEASGTVSLPIYSRLDDMEAKITKIGEDLGFIKILQQGLTSHVYEFRWATETLKRLGFTTAVGGKSFIKGMVKGVPSISLEPGEASENEITIECLTYRLIVDGVEHIKIDKLNHITRVGTTDVSMPVNLLVDL